MQIQQAQQNAALQQQLLGFQQQQFNAISPFANQAIGFGQNALGQLQDIQNGKIDQNLYNAFLTPQKNALASGFQQAGQNLVDALGATGGYGSGIGMGPLANLQTQQAIAQSNANANAYQNAYTQGLQNAYNGLNLGFQGANLLYGQQAVFNPATYGDLSKNNAQIGTQNIQTNYAPSFGSQLLGALGGAGIGAFTGALGTKLGQKI